MSTIRDRIQAWANSLLSQSALARSEDARNTVQDEVQKLLAEPWASQTVKDEPVDKGTPAST